MYRYTTYGVRSIIIVISLLHLGYNVHTYAMLNLDISEALSLEEIDENHTILRSIPGEWAGLSDSLGFLPEYVHPFAHVECLFAVTKGISYLNKYEANTDHFPLRYKEKDLVADYVIVWRTEYEDSQGLEEEYEMVDSNKYNRLYRRNRTLPDVQLLKDRLSVAFDMQPHDAKTRQGFIPYTQTQMTLTKIRLVDKIG